MGRYLPELAAAVVAPVAFLAFVAVRGWGVGGSRGVYLGVAVPDVLVQVVPFVAGGALVAVRGWRHGLRTVPSLLALALVAPTLQPAPSNAAPATTLAVPVGTVAVLGILLGGVEYALRKPVGVRQYYTRRSLLAGAAVGMLPVLAVLLPNLDGLDGNPVLALLFAVWAGPGLFLLFGVPVALSVHPRLHSPAVVTYGFVGWSIVQFVRAETPGWLFVVGGIWWFVPLAVGLLAGVGESLLRRRYERSRGHNVPMETGE